jgi:hypothetical protein
MESSPLPPPLYHFGLPSRPRADESAQGVRADTRRPVQPSHEGRAARRGRKGPDKRGEKLDLLI